MNREEAKQYFLGLRSAQRGQFLALLSHNLTVAARASYAVIDSPADPSTRQATLEGLNEIQHRLSAHFRKLLGDPQAGFPDEVLMDVLFGWAESLPTAKEDFLWALETTARYYQTDGKKKRQAAVGPESA